jgi:hypothetical protein
MVTHSVTPVIKSYIKKTDFHFYKFGTAFDHVNIKNITTSGYSSLQGNSFL